MHLESLGRKLKVITPLFIRRLNLKSLLREPRVERKYFLRNEMNWDESLLF